MSIMNYPKKTRSAMALALCGALGCSGGLQASGGLKLDSSTGLSAKLDTKAATNKGEETKGDTQPRELGEALNDAIAASHRSPENKARDKYRHPKETLAFFGMKTDMTVLEVEPGADGWYTEILAPVLREHGTYVATNFDAQGPEKSPLTKVALAFAGKLDANPEVYDKVKVVLLTKEYELGEADSVDMVVTFRNSHLWKQDKIEDQVYDAMFKVLKPGGVLGIVQHRACAGDSATRTYAKGYLPQPYLVERIEKAGFVYEEESHINANSFDTRDYAKGVWTLPPSLAQGDKDREKYEKIGESDRMTLRFRKPKDAPAAAAEETPEDGSGTEAPKAGETEAPPEDKAAEASKAADPGTKDAAKAAASTAPVTPVAPAPTPAVPPAPAVPPTP